MYMFKFLTQFIEGLGNINVYGEDKKLEAVIFFSS